VVGRALGAWVLGLLLTTTAPAGRSRQPFPYSVTVQATCGDVPAPQLVLDELDYARAEARRRAIHRMMRQAAFRACRGSAEKLEHRLRSASETRSGF